MKLKKVTIRDVAKHAEVSIAAVSYVLNGKEDKVSAKTLQKIKKSIETLNYIPNYSARSLVSNTSKLVGVMIPQTEERKQLLLENPYYSEIISGIELKLRECGYHLIISGTVDGESYLNLSLERNLDGVIIMGIYPEQLYEEFKQVKIPIVLVDSYIYDPYFKKIGINDEYGGYLATKHLIDHRHRNIALVTGTIKEDGVVEKRFLGYKRALQEANIFYNPNYVFEESVSYSHGLKSGETIANQYPEITAVFATADMVALGVINGIHQAGKRVPDDISVIGFDNISISKMFIPNLTTIDQYITQKGIKAAEMLVELIEETPETANPIEKEMILPIEVLERQTVKLLEG